MAKVTAPLLSLEASGAYGSTLVFAKHTGRNTVRKKRVSIAPPDPKTPVQLFNREYFAIIVSDWQQLDSDSKRRLDILGAIVSYSGFNWYVKEYRERRPTECGNVRCGFSELGDLTF
jgi:hypothetical protein